MTEKNNKIKWLTYIISLLIAAMLFGSGLYANVVSSWGKYVPLERYKTDIERLEKKVDKILDYMIAENG